MGFDGMMSMRDKEEGLVEATYLGMRGGLKAGSKHTPRGRE